jgi:hypothetical protein
MGVGTSVAAEFVTGSITSRSPGESTVDYGDGIILAGNDVAPATSPAVLDAVRGYNPWLHQLDFDHHGYLRVSASAKSLEVQMRRMSTIKRRDTTMLPQTGYRWVLSPDDTSLPGSV